MHVRGTDREIRYRNLGPIFDVIDRDRKKLANSMFILRISR